MEKKKNWRKRKQTGKKKNKLGKENVHFVCEIRAVCTVDALLAWALHTSLWCVAVLGLWLLSHTQAPLSVSTGNHRCDDPPRQDGEPPERQLVQCVVACVHALALWMSS